MAEAELRLLRDSDSPVWRPPEPAVEKPERVLRFDQSLIDYFAEVGYQPEYGARELRRQIRSQLETLLANAMLKGEIEEGDKVTFSYDRTQGIRWKKEKAPSAAAATPMPPPPREAPAQAQPTTH